MLFCQYRGDGKEDDLSVIFSRVDLAFGEEEGGLKVVPPNASLIPYKASSLPVYYIFCQCPLPLQYYSIK
jgi:hypothetical protein